MKKTIEEMIEFCSEIEKDTSTTEEIRENYGQLKTWLWELKEFKELWKNPSQIPPGHTQSCCILRQWGGKVTIEITEFDAVLEVFGSGAKLDEVILWAPIDKDDIWK